MAFTFLVLAPVLLVLPVRAAETAMPPSPELIAAEAALARAESADAQQYAADALLRARSSFNQAQAKWAERKKPDANLLAQLAAAEADYAYSRSREATLQSDLKQRRREIRELRAKLGIEGQR
jgi:multidrug efflux pump subunit AcrA (membrane-fusion protein)